MKGSCRLIESTSAWTFHTHGLPPSIPDATFATHLFLDFTISNL